MKWTRSVQRAAGLATAGLTITLVANSVYLVSTETPGATLLQMQQAHKLLGLGLGVALPLFVWTHYRLHARHRNVRAKRIGKTTAWVAAIGCVTGFLLWGLGKSSETIYLVYLHELGFAGSLLVYVWHRQRAKARRPWWPEWLGVVLAAALLAAVFVGQANHTNHAPTETAVEVALLQPGLSQTQTVDGHVLAPQDLANPGYCAQCHPAIAERWEASAHRHSSLNDPFYAKTLAFAQEHRSPEQLKFCGGCHDPQLLLTGRMDSHPTPASPGADEGITCLGCHAIVERPSRVGNGSYIVAPPQHYPDYNSPDADARDRSNRLLRSKPQQHRQSFAPDHLHSPELCGACHKAHIPKALNDYRWIRGQNEFDAWHDSGAGGYSARTFFAPGAQKRCQDCHMPKITADDPAADSDGKVADHGFLGANTALPAALDNTSWQTRNAEFLRGVVSLDIAAVQRQDVPTQDRVLAPAAPLSHPANAPLIFDIVVRNRRSGHFYPGGITDLREAWLEVQLLAEDGRVLAASGWLEPNGGLEPGAHRWNSVLLGPDSETLHVHNVEDTRVVLSSRRIMLGASDVIRVAVSPPATPSTLQVRVLDRKFPQDYVRFALGEEALPVPVVEVATTSLALKPGAWNPVEPPADSGARLRDLGIAHLLRGDTQLAKAAAMAAATRLPDDPGPHLDLARGALADGAIDLAEAHLRDADKRAPGHPTAAWLLARVHQARGDHLGALQPLAVALAAFPRDRELLLMQANSQYRLEREDQALTTLQQILDIDPEHLGAHALLTRIYGEQGKAEAAARHRQIWDQVRPSSADRVITQRARERDPMLSRRADRQYILELAPPPADAEFVTAD